MSDQTTKYHISEMMKEHVATSIVDSGDFYGRNFERNADRDFESEPVGSISLDGSRFSVSVSLYHFLTHNLVYDEEMNDLFSEWEAEQESSSSFGTLLNKWVTEKYKDAETGPYGESDLSNGLWSGYTYNMKNILDQDFVFYQWMHNNNCYIAIQIHNGCDARMGFTTPRIFQESGCSELGWADFDRAGICCDECDASASSDGHEWEWFNGEGNSIDIHAVPYDPDSLILPDFEDNPPYPPPKVDMARYLIGEECIVTDDDEDCFIYKIEFVNAFGEEFKVGLAGVNNSAILEIDLCKIRLLSEARNMKWSSKDKTFICPVCKVGKLGVYI